VGIRKTLADAIRHFANDKSRHEWERKADVLLGRELDMRYDVHSGKNYKHGINRGKGDGARRSIMLEWAKAEAMQATYANVPAIRQVNERDTRQSTRRSERKFSKRNGFLPRRKTGQITATAHA
jgi:hypothetical protein